MAKAKAGAKKVKPAAKKTASPKLGLIKSSSKVKSSGRAEAKAPKAAKSRDKGRPEAGVKATAESRAVAQRNSPFDGPAPDKPMPRATKLPAMGQPLTKREMEQLLTAGVGRGVDGEGSLKGRLVVKDGFPYLHVVGRDKRELIFLLQGPDQEVFPAYADHKVSVSGRIKKTTNYGGIVDVRKYSAKPIESEAAPVEAPVEAKLKFLSPGEVEQLCSAGMGAGMKGFAAMRGMLEMTGEDFFLVVSNPGTRHQVSFVLEGKGAKGLRKYLGQTLQVNGVVEKTAGWGGKIEVENFEPRPHDHRAASREGLEISHIDGSGESGSIELKVNQGLTVRFQERAGYTWAVEPMIAKRVGLREANYEPSSGGPATREFFFTPRTPGQFEVEFFLAKAFLPAQVAKTFKLTVVVKP